MTSGKAAFAFPTWFDGPAISLRELCAIETVSLVDTLATLSAIVGADLPPVTQGAEDSFNVPKPG